MDKTINKCYTAFCNLDVETMVNQYHKDIVFEDPAFGKLEGEYAKNMWRMLCQNAKDIKVDYTDVFFNDNLGRAHWEAIYPFSQKGRTVHNIVTAKFEFKDGLIIKHTDSFNLHEWAKQALGFKGFLLDGTGFFKKKLNQQTNQLLAKFEGTQKQK
jgi:hypothetical protein